MDLNNGVTCLVTHGHLYDVKQSLQKLSYRADELSVNFCFFGHTHVAGTASINNTFFINPGSLKSPRNSIEKTYAILELETTKDRKSTRLNSSHVAISYAVFCLNKKKNNLYLLSTV